MRKAEKGSDVEVVESWNSSVPPRWVYEEMNPHKENGWKTVRRNGHEWEQEYRPHKPKKLSIEQVRKHYEGKEELLNDVSCSFRWDHVPTDLERLVGLCTAIVHTDTMFENKITEIEGAKKIAQENLKRAEAIRDMIKEAKPENAGLMRKILGIMDICYIRVLGDQMKGIPFEGINLEDWIRRIYYDKDLSNLKELSAKEDLYQVIFKNQ